MTIQAGRGLGSGDRQDKSGTCPSAAPMVLFPGGQVAALATRARLAALSINFDAHRSITIARAG